MERLGVDYEKNGTRLCLLSRGEGTKPRRNGGEKFLPWS